jgi:hypothetical protein
MENSKRQAIASHLTGIWSKFQPRSADKNLLGHGREIEPPDRVESSTEAARSDYPPPQAISDSTTKLTIANEPPDRDLFSEIMAPISNLNLPPIDIDPRAAFWAVLAAMVGGTGITSYLLLIAVPPTPNCQGILPISADNERLYCAQVGAETKQIPKLRSAVDLVKGWTDRHPLYRESQRLLTTWSEDLIRIGRKQLNDGKIEQAIATVKIVPPSSPIYDRAQETIAKWAHQARDSSKIDANFDRAIATADWNEAFAILQTVQRMRGTYWNGFKYDRMAAKLARERNGWDKLQEAKDALEETPGEDYNTRAKRIELAVKAAKKAKENHTVVAEAPLPTQPEPIVKAMNLANQIDRSTFVYRDGQTLRNKWSKHLLQLSIDLYKAQNFNEAIAIVQKVPHDVPVYTEAQDWAKLNQAHIWAGKRHLLAMMDAIAQVKKIPKTSPIYSIARAKQTNWQGMLKQQTQLQWAKSIASFQQPATLSLAIATAKQVPTDSEAGKTIQGDIATWSRQIETVDNRIVLAKARQIVTRGESLANLKAAVHLAGKITKDRPLGEEIVGYVADWNEKIQTIEDRPILANAIALATQGNLAQAISVANRIAPGRSLYREAQGEIRYWNLELQEIADRRTLERAISIYRQGKISTAIDLAATIGRRSPIYSDARAYVADWRLLLTPRMSRN